MLTRKNDPEDERRVREIHEKYQNQVRLHNSMPSHKTLEDMEMCGIDDNGTIKLGMRIKNKLYAVTLTEV